MTNELPETPVDFVGGGPGHGRAAFAFIFVTVLLDMLALGIIVPVLPKLIIRFEHGDMSIAATQTGVFAFVWALMQFVFAPVTGALRKVVTAAAAAEAAERWRTRGYKVGFTNGCFDLLHPGHVHLLEQCRAMCDRLIVGINADASVKRLKGPSRPAQGDRGLNVPCGEGFVWDRVFDPVMPSKARLCESPRLPV